MNMLAVEHMRTVAVLFKKEVLVAISNKGGRCCCNLSVGFNYLMRHMFIFTLLGVNAV